MHGTKKIHSDMIFLMVAVLSAYNIDNKIALAQVSIETHGSIVVGQSIVLECKVTSFGGGGATWSQDNGNTILTQCNTGGLCTDSGTGNYLYTSNSNGINVTISLTSSELGKTWTCTHDIFKASKTVSASPISQMSESTATEEMTFVNSVFEFSNITIPTSDIPTSSSSNINTGSTNINAITESTFVYSNIETTLFYTKTETTTTTNLNTETTSLNANIESTIFNAITDTTDIYVITETYEIETKTLGIVSNSMSINQSMFVTTASNYTSGSFDTTSQIMTDPFAPPAYSISLYNEITVPTIFETSNFVSQTFSETSISINFSKNSIFSMTISPSYIGDSFIAPLSAISPVMSLMTNTPVSFFEISNVSIVKGFSLTTETGQTHVTVAFVDSIGKSEKSEGVYSSGISSLRNSDTNTSIMPSETQLWSINDIQMAKSDFRSTSFDQYSQLTYKVNPSRISEYSENVLQSTGLLLSFNTTEESTETYPFMKTTNMLNFATQSSILTMDTFLFTNHSSIQISTVLPDFETTWYATTINYNTKAMPSMITPSSQRKNSDNSYNEIGTSSKDLSFFINSFSESVTSGELLMTTLSSEIIESISTLSTSTTQSGLSEKNKNIIFISTTSAAVTIILVILLMIFAKLYSLKPPEEGDNISWSNHSSPPKAAFPYYSVTGKRIYPLLNTSSTSFQMHHYEHNWVDIV